MAAIGCGGAKGFLHRKAAAPGFAPRLLRTQKIGEIDRRHPGPDAAGAAEIGDAQFGADAGAGKDDGAARVGDQSAKFGDIGIVRHGAIVAKLRPRAKPDVRYCVGE